MLLSNAKKNNIYVIDDIQNDGAFVERLWSLGFVRGAKIIPLQISCGKSLQSFSISGSQIALRTENTKKIFVHGDNP